LFFYPKHQYANNHQIIRIDKYLDPQFVGMISHIEQPIVEAWKLSLDVSKVEIKKFVTNFMDNLPTSLSQNPDGAPQILVYDSSQPLDGFSALGPEGLNCLADIEPIEEHGGLRSPQDGDIVIFQARKDEPYSGGSTKLGELRSAIYNAALTRGVRDRRDLDDSFKFLWVTGFPMFTIDDGIDPGQGGSAGFSATHHPFTAPLTEADFALLFTNPLEAKADHYDLVLNGVEIGGGSRRIHVAAIQEFVMRNILQMSEERIRDFSHLLEALRAGCPPHAGFAMGFDRFCAVLSDTPSVRDVIAFPKSMKGEDLFAKSPGRVTPGQLETYHLQMISRKQ
jgi:aspartyl-tRNA synthetase